MNKKNKANFKDINILGLTGYPEDLTLAECYLPIIKSFPEVAKCVAIKGDGEGEEEYGNIKKALQDAKDVSAKFGIKPKVIVKKSEADADVFWFELYRYLNRRANAPEFCFVVKIDEGRHYYSFADREICRRAIAMHVWLDVENCYEKKLQKLLDNNSDLLKIHNRIRYINHDTGESIAHKIFLCAQNIHYKISKAGDEVEFLPAAHKELYFSYKFLLEYVDLDSVYNNLDIRDELMIDRLRNIINACICD